MVRKSWETPRAMAEEFEANEYVAACWGVACQVDWANQFERQQGDYNHGVTHDSDHCGNPRNQVIYDYNSDGIADAMIEEGTDGLGDLRCEIFGDRSYSSPLNISDVKSRMTIYWTTSSSDGRTWNHRGKVFNEYPGRPNHS